MSNRSARNDTSRPSNRSSRKSARRATLDRRQLRAFHYGLSGRPGAR